MKQSGLTILTPVLAGHAWGQLASDIKAQQGRLRGVPGLHFLSLFVVPPDKISDRAYVGLEANFDGDKTGFLEALIGANSQFLHDVFRRCFVYVQNDNVVLRNCLMRAQRTEHIFYVAHPGHTTGRIEEERELAAQVEARIALLDRPTGRRHDIIREVWQGLSDKDRQTVLTVPKEPIWVKKSGNLTGTLLTIGKWLAYGVGWIVLLLVIAKYFAGDAWQSDTPPGWVLSEAWCWTKALFWIVVGAGGLFFALFVFEFPRGLRSRTMVAIFLKKVLGFVWITLRAGFGFGGIVGLLTLWSWCRDDVWAWVACIASLVSTWWPLLIALVLASVIAYFWLARSFTRQEMEDSVYGMTWDRAHMMQMRAREELEAQNHFISVVDVRPSRLRRCLLRCVLWVINRAAWFLHNPRGLFSSQSIHFARWCLLHERKLLFITNYNGGFGGYLDIFATLGACGVSAIWGHTVDFPRTFLMVLDGCRDEQRFKARARGSQIETLLWYRRYPDLTNTAIARNATIRKELRRFANNDPDLHEADLDVFLRRFAVRNP